MINSSLLTYSISTQRRKESKHENEWRAREEAIRSVKDTDSVKEKKKKSIED